MSIVIERYDSNRLPAIDAFNRRLDAGGVPAEFRFPATFLSGAPSRESAGLYEEGFVASEADAVRGCYFLKHQDFVVRGVTRSIAQYRLPISEGIIDRRYVGVGARLITDALLLQPLLFALGMGSIDNPLPRLLRALGWSLWKVPFFFRACHPSRVAKTLFAQRAATQPLLGVRGAGLLGGLALRALHTRPRSPRRRHGISSKILTVFDDDVDALWDRCAHHYTMIGVRRSQQLQTIYPPDEIRFIRLAVYADDEIVGWAVLLDTAMKDHRHFGDLRVGTIVDGLALPEHAPLVVAAAARLLEDRGVDLIVSNQAHAAWRQAMRAAGLLPGPSNYILACSPALAKLLEPFDTTKTRVHMTRGDGDGPIHL